MGWGHRWYGSNRYGHIKGAVNEWGCQESSRSEVHQRKQYRRRGHQRVWSRGGVIKKSENET